MKLRIVYADGSSLEVKVGKFTVIKTPKPMINIDRLPSGDFRLIITESLLPRGKGLDKLEFLSHHSSFKGEKGIR